MAEGVLRQPSPSAPERAGGSMMESRRPRRRDRPRSCGYSPFRHSRTGCRRRLNCRGHGSRPAVRRAGPPRRPVLWPLPRAAALPPPLPRAAALPPPLPRAAALPPPLPPGGATPQPVPSRPALRCHRPSSCRFSQSSTPSTRRHCRPGPRPSPPEGGQAAGLVR